MKENSRRYLGSFKWRDAAELRAFLAERYITAVFKRRIEIANRKTHTNGTEEQHDSAD